MKPLSDSNLISILKSHASLLFSNLNLYSILKPHSLRKVSARQQRVESDGFSLFPHPSDFIDPSQISFFPGLAAVPGESLDQDLSGRRHLSYDLSIPTERVGTYDTQVSWDNVPDQGIGSWDNKDPTKVAKSTSRPRRNQ